MSHLWPVPLRALRALPLAVAFALSSGSCGNAEMDDRPPPPAVEVVHPPGGVPEAPPPVPSGVPVLSGVLSASDAVELGDGWALLDMRSHRIHIISADGELQRSVGRRGDGPGELQRPTALIRSGPGFAAVDLSGRRLDLFTSDGEFVDRRTLRPEACGRGSTVIAASGSRRAGGPIHLLVQCTNLWTGNVSGVVDRIDPQGGSTRVAERLLFNVSGKGDVAPATAIFDERDGEVILGTSYDPCLDWIREDGTAARVCHPRPSARALPPSERRRFDSLARSLEARLPGSAIPVPESLPLFDAAFLGTEGIWFRTVTGVHERRLAYLGQASVTADSVPLSAHEASWVGDRSILAVWEAEDGTALQVIPIPDPAQPAGSGAG